MYHWFKGLGVFIIAFSYILCASHLFAAENNKVKIFILSGQSNMVGQGRIHDVNTLGTVDYIAKNDPFYRFLVDGNGDFIIRDDVSIKTQFGTSGGLGPGYGTNSSHVGPELGFGHKMGELFDDHILIIKAAWGGKSLAVDFRPPSSGSTTGFYYNELVSIVHDAISNIADHVPNYNNRGYEIVGFGWHQGWNDRVNPPFVEEYADNMENFINDIRAEFKVPKLPFVIATTGMDGSPEGYTDLERAQMSLADGSLYPAFVGNVKVIDTRSLYEEIRFWQAEEDSPVAQGFHWNQNAKTYINIGLAIADQMSTMVPGRCPYRLKASSSGDSVRLQWHNGVETPTSLNVFRNGVVIANGISAANASYVDNNPIAGLNHYTIEFTMPGQACNPLSVSYDGSVVDASLELLDGNHIRLTWENNLSYPSITVLRNSIVLKSNLSGSATSFIDDSAPAGGEIVYTIQPNVAGSLAKNIKVNLSLRGELGILDLLANDRINPATREPWKAGDQYRLAFVTSKTTDAQSFHLPHYDGLATRWASEAGIGGQWQILGSSGDINARFHTETDYLTHGVGVSVFLLDGKTRVANNNIDLWNKNLDHPINRDELGNANFNVPVITGSEESGDSSDRHLGGSDETDPKVVTGNSGNFDRSWLWSFNTGYKSQSHFYALSKPLTVIDDAADNNVPNATNKSVSLFQGSTVDITLEASDTDNDELTYHVVSQPAHGVLSGTAQNLTYKPNNNFSGQDTFTYIANDGLASSEPATVSIEVLYLDTSMLPELGILDMSANGGINPATNQAWKTGDQYRFVFLSSQKIAAETEDLAVYDAFLQSLADTAELGGQWKVIGSSGAIHAKDHTDTNGDEKVAIMLIDGATVIASNYEELWDGYLDAPINIDENSNLLGDAVVHTGTNPNGTKRDRHLGGSTESTSKVTTGKSTRSNNGWMVNYNTAASNPQHIYAISSVLRIGSKDVAPVEVPDVVNLNTIQAEEAITQVGLVVGESTTAYSDTIAEGSIISQNPFASTTVNVGSRVDLIVSLGSDRVSVPGVVAMNRVNAEAAIIEAGLTLGSLTESYSDTVVKGAVISQNPSASSSVSVGSSVHLLVSLGSGNVSVPELVGQEQTAAESAIIEAQLSVGNISRNSSETVAEGFVISQNPSASSMTTIGSRIDLVVSSGPDNSDDLPYNQQPDMTKPVKVFILMGQSNMFGFGTIGSVDEVGTLEYYVKGQKNYQNLIDESGQWVERKDARYVQVMESDSGMQLVANEQMTITNRNIGPEIGLGHLIGDALDEPVLILKTCIGNRSLGWDLLPPGSEQYEYDGMIYAGYGQSPQSWIKGEEPQPIEWYAGKQYDDDVRNAKTILEQLDQYYPGATAGFEVAGFAWWQGHKDQYADAHTSKYEENMVRLIKSLRKDFDAPNAPFVLATVGFGGYDLKGNALSIAKTQLAVSGETGNHPEFLNNVKTIESRGFWRPASESPRDVDFHYNLNAATYMDVGNALGEEMVKLLEYADNNPPVNVPNVVSKSRDDAETAITGVGLTLGNITLVSSDTVAAGIVISQEPSAPNSATAGSGVNLVVSKGVTAPEVLIGELGILDLKANDGINPATFKPWKSGDKYRLVFVSSISTTGESNDLTTYDQFLNDLAEGAGIGGSWKVIGSSGSIDAKDHTSTNEDYDGNDIGVILIDGSTVVAKNYKDLWNGYIAHSINMDEKGNAGLTGSVLTGTSPDGSKEDRHLGGSDETPPKVTIGKIEKTTRGWLVNYNLTATSAERLYAISTQLTVRSETAPAVDVPNVVNMTKTQAQVTITNNGLVSGKVTSIYSDTVAADLVISQNPAALNSVVEGTSVDLVISLGATPQLTVPNVVNQLQSQAEQTIDASHLVVGSISSVYNNSIAAGRVVSQSPAASTSVSTGSAVNLVISLGENTVSVPNLVNLLSAQAEEQIVNNSLSVGTITSAHSSTVALGAVISQLPEAYSNIAAGSPIHLIISLGPEDSNEPVNLVGELGILNLEANQGINPATGQAWKLGDTYRLVFLSSTSTTAQSNDLTTYDTFLNDLAREAGLGGNWKVIGSSGSTDAKQHTSTNGGIHGNHVSIILIDGSTLIAKNYKNLWDGYIDHSINIDEKGNTGLTGSVFTGTRQDGSKEDRHLGGSDESPPKVTIGKVERTNRGWLINYNLTTSSAAPLYAISDPLNVKLSGTVPSNSAPVAANQSLHVDASNSINFILTATDTDHDLLSFSVVNQPSKGSLSGSAPNLTYTPTLGFNGHDSFTFIANDGKLTSAEATVSITINSNSNAVPGLWYGELPGNINLSGANPQTELLIDVSSKTEDRIGENTTEVYTGQIYDADGIISFTERIDDKTLIYINGRLVLSDDNWKNRTSTGKLAVNAGWNDIEIRISNGGGDSGPVDSPGIGFDPEGGNNWQLLRDTGDGSLLRVPLVAQQTAAYYSPEQDSAVLVTILNNNTGTNLTGQLYSFTHTVSVGETKNYSAGSGTTGTYVTAVGVSSPDQVITLEDKSFELTGSQLSGNIVMSALPLSMDENTPPGAQGKLMSFDGLNMGGTFTVPLAHIGSGLSYKLYRQGDDGIFVDTEKVVSIEGNYASFTLDSFSVYVLVDENAVSSQSRAGTIDSNSSAGGGGCLLKRRKSLN